MIKYVYTIDYPLGKKNDYLVWVKAIGTTLQEPAELKRVRSYVNFLAGSPNRVTELEFDDAAAAATYFEREAIRTILEDLHSYGTNIHVHVLTQRGDYTKG